MLIFSRGFGWVVCSTVHVFRPHYELLDFCDPVDPLDLIYRDGESPGYYPSTPPHHQHHHHQKGRPRKRKLMDGDAACGEIPVAMRMAAATLGKNYYIEFCVHFWQISRKDLVILFVSITWCTTCFVCCWNPSNFASWNYVWVIFSTIWTQDLSKAAPPHVNVFFSFKMDGPRTTAVVRSFGMSHRYLDRWNAARSNSKSQKAAMRSLQLATVSILSDPRSVDTFHLSANTESDHPRSRNKIRTETSKFRPFFRWRVTRDSSKLFKMV